MTTYFISDTEIIDKDTLDLVAFLDEEQRRVIFSDYINSLDLYPNTCSEILHDYSDWTFDYYYTPRGVRH